MEYIPNIPSLSSYVINICLYLAKTLHIFESYFKSMIYTNGDYFNKKKSN